jgi:diguanylate cyclase (GGDEF)-like protein
MDIPRASRLLTLAALSTVYLVAAKFGLAFASVNPSATAIWPPAGITLAAFLVLDYGVWPAILVGAFLSNLTTQGSVAASLGISLGNVLEGLIGAYLINRFANGRLFFQRPRHVMLFAGLGAVVSTTVSASVGVTSLALDGLARWADVGPIWLTWWLGDAAGDLIVAPVLVLWSSAPRLRWRGGRSLEAVAVVVSLSAVAFIVFDGFGPAVGAEHLPLAFLCTPFLFWAAFRLGRRAVVECVLVLSLISIWATLRGFGPFARPSQNESLLVLQAHLAVEAVTMLAVAAVVWERRQAELQLRRLATIDALTDLANYRHLVTVLISEIQRSQRTNHPFVLLLLDLDGLKRVNDRHGHLAGNRALCRVADALRASVRSTDVAARFGGDEFACVLPETSHAGAEELANRIGERLASDHEQPRISVSLGWAIYPRDGGTAELLLSVADRKLYEAKASRETPSEILP